MKLFSNGTKVWPISLLVTKCLAASIPIRPFQAVFFTIKRWEEDRIANTNDGNRAEDMQYHNTLLLLQKYRDIVWSIESAMLRTRINFERAFGRNLEEFLDLAYSAGAGLDLNFVCCTTDFVK